MEKITTTIELEYAIKVLERKIELEKHELKEHFFLTVESFKPINIIKDTFSEMVASTDLQTDVSKIALGTISGYLAKQVILGETHNPISKGLGVVLEMVVSKNVIRNSDGIKIMGQNLLKKIFNYPSTSSE